MLKFHQNILLVICGFIFILRCVNSDHQSNELSIECGKSSKLFEECFKNFSQSSLYMWKMKSIPLTKEEISDRCLIFNQGIKCFGEYTSKCIDTKSKQLLEGEVAGAKSFYDMLCKDKGFKSDYLMHGDCFRYVQKDWDACTVQFVSILKEEMMKFHTQEKVNINVQYMHFCCARFAYENCIFNSASHKCKPESAVFVRRIAELLSTEKQFKNCEKIEDHLCSGTTKVSLNLWVIFAVVLISFSRIYKSTFLN